MDHGSALYPQPSTPPANNRLEKCKSGSPSEVNNDSGRPAASTVEYCCASMQRRVYLWEKVFAGLVSATSTIKVESMWLSVVINRDEAAISEVDVQVQMLDETCLYSRPVTAIALSLAARWVITTR